MSSTNQKLLGQRLKQARTNCRMSQEEVAEALGVPRTALVHIEDGTRSISSLELATLARLYNRSLDSFFEEQAEQQDDDALLALCRVSPEFQDTPQVQKEISRCVGICKEGFQLKALLQQNLRSGPPAYELPQPKSYEEANEQGVQVASSERKRLGIGDGPIADIVELISTQGIWTSRMDLPDAMSGLFLRHSSIGMVILVNHGHCASRQRFSYAHEYAHALLDRNQVARITTADNSAELIERRANSFASAFLLPKAGVEELVKLLGKGLPTRQTVPVYDVAKDAPSEIQQRQVPGSQTIGYQDIAFLMNCFGVSYQTAVFRLETLGIIKHPERQPLLEKEAAAQRYLEIVGFGPKARPEEDKLGRELKLQIAWLAIDAFRRELISKGKLLDISLLLDIRGRDLIEVAEEARAVS